MYWSQLELAHLPWATDQFMWTEKSLAALHLRNLEFVPVQHAAAREKITPSTPASVHSGSASRCLAQLTRLAVC